MRIPISERLVNVVKASSICSLLVSMKKGELKGIWLRPVETSEKEIIASINRIQQAGIDNIFLGCFLYGKQN